MIILLLFVLVSLLMFNYSLWSTYSLTKELSKFSKKFKKAIWKRYGIGLMLGLMFGFTIGKFIPSIIKTYFTVGSYGNSPVGKFLVTFVGLLLIYSPAFVLFSSIKELRVKSDSYLLAKLREKEIPLNVLETLKEELGKINTFSIGVGIALGESIALTFKFFTILIFFEVFIISMFSLFFMWEKCEKERKLASVRQDRIVENPWK